MDSPEKIPIEEALARGLIACTTCGVKGPGVRRVEARFACEACAAKKGGHAAAWLAGGALLLLLVWAAWLLRPGEPPKLDPFVAELDVLLQQRRFAEARDLLKARLAAAPGDPGLHIYLGHALFNLGHVEDALAEFRKGNELDPSTAALGEIWVGICLHRLGYAREALPLLEKPVPSGEMEERRRQALAETLLDLERYDDALKLLPPTARDPRSIFNRHRGLRYGGKTAEADALLASLDPKEAWSFRATLLREQGDFDGARKLLAEHKATTDAFRAARAELTLALEAGDLARLFEPIVEPGDGLWFRAVGMLLAGKRDEAVKAAREFLAKTDPKLASLRQNRLMMRYLAGEAKLEDLEAEAQRVHRFQSADYYFFLAAATGDKSWAAKGVEGSPGHNFPYHALKRLAGR
jgi:tetratricopeptide (TPR) repeat protein